MLFEGTEKGININPGIFVASKWVTICGAVSGYIWPKRNEINKSVEINIAEIKPTSLNLKRRGRRKADGNSKVRCTITAAVSPALHSRKNDKYLKDEGKLERNYYNWVRLSQQKHSCVAEDAIQWCLSRVTIWDVFTCQVLTVESAEPPTKYVFCTLYQ